MKFARRGRFDTLALLALLLAIAGEAWAQGQRRTPTPNDTLKFTEVANDHKVTFRIYAPKATEVSVQGDFGGGKMSKDEKGVWSITVGPLTPDYYSYRFIVDGVRTIDPKNAMIKPGMNSIDSMFLVSGPEADFETLKDVPHGEVRTAWYHSGTIDQNRSIARLHAARLRRGDPNSTRSSTCCTAAATKTRDGRRSGGPASYSITSSPRTSRCR